jgi:alpha-ketoglutarate-dependent 2,4-dichlorophenoxyacetate dioxygenase
MIIYPVTEGLAAEIGDIDLSKPLSGEGRAEIETAFNRYSVLVFPDQQLSTDQHLVSTFAGKSLAPVRA